MGQQGQYQRAAQTAATGMERALFTCEPVLRSIWPDLSEYTRFDLFDLHRADIALAYRFAIGAAKIITAD